jgi:SAM-dependent methyltransferase
MVTRDEVVYAFRLVLGREPENAAVIDQFLGIPDWENLRNLFFASAEFGAKTNSAPAADMLTSFINSPPNSVDVEVSASHFDHLVRHVQASWEALGRKQPHWSVLTEPIFLPDNIKNNVEYFYDTGGGSLHALEKAAARAGKGLPSNWTCFELGCGVGRVTAYLARRFGHVIAADISKPHLTLADAYLQSKDVRNVSLVQLTSLGVLESLQPFDLFYSIIVLQHNPPPLIYRMLQLIFDKVKIGGYVYFQVPVAYPDYSFSIEKYIGTIGKDEGTMEMHVLPQAYLFRALDEHGFRLLDLQRDSWTGPAFHSVALLAEKTS